MSSSLIYALSLDPPSATKNTLHFYGMIMRHDRMAGMSSLPFNLLHLIPPFFAFLLLLLLLF